MLDELNANVTSWLAHIHYDNGTIKEIQVVAPRGANKIALDRVKQAAGITSLRQVDLVGIFLKEEITGAKPIVLGHPQKIKKESGVVAPSSVTLNKYKVRAFLSNSNATPITAWRSAKTAWEALSDTIASFGGNPEVSTQWGPYWVQQETSSGFIECLRKGDIWEKHYGAPPKLHVRLGTPVPATVPVVSPVVSDFRKLLLGETLVTPVIPRLVFKEFSI